MTAKKTEDLRCKECNSVLAYAKDLKQYRYGTPFQKCSNCQCEYIDPRFHEITVDGYHVTDRLYLPVWKFLLTIAALVVLAFALSSYSAWYFGFEGTIVFFVIGAFATIIALCMDVSSLATYAKRQKKLMALKEESVLRVKNPSYAKKLQEAGFEIRFEYRDEEESEEEVQPVFRDQTNK